MTTAIETRKRAGHFKPRKIDGQSVCLDCDTPVHPEPYLVRKVAPLRCRICRDNRRKTMSAIKAEAHGAVAAAIRGGLLLPPHMHKCDDCGRRAEQYDHRDYTQPLKVDAVCCSCNILRGPADVWREGFSPAPKAI